jgi:hypothetical protein
MTNQTPAQRMIDDFAPKWPRAMSAIILARELFAGGADQ